MRKRIWTLTLAALVIFTALPVCAAEPSFEEGAGNAVCLIEAKSGAVLTAKNEKEAYDAAGLARLPALLLVCEAVDAGTISLGETVSVSENAASVRGPTAFLSAGERMALGELVKSAVMITAGDALCAASEALDASDQSFVEKVNLRLEKLQINALYTDRNGTGVLFSAEELARIGAALCKSETFLRYSGLYYEKLVHESGLVTEMASANKLLKTCAGCNGVATGSSAEAGYCGVFSAQRDTGAYVCVILGAKNAAERAMSAKSMLEYAFSAYRCCTLAAKGQTLQENVPVSGGVVTSCDLIAARDVFAVLPKEGEYSEKRDIPEKLCAPLHAGEALGSVVYLNADGETLARVDLTVAEDLEEAAWQDYFKRFLLRHLYL